MKRTIIIGLAFFLATVFISSSAAAADASFDLNINTKDVEGRIDIKVNPMETPLSIGGGFLYSDDKTEYWLANLNVAVKDEVFTPALSLGLGLKGLFGNTDFVTFDRDTAALAFQFLGDYDFRKTSVNIPISIFASVAYAPEILSFSDTDRYFDFYTGVSFHINYFAAVYAGYRDIEIKYKAGGTESKLSDDAFFIGIRISF
jgi:hypothetical protein